MEMLSQVCMLFSALLILFGSILLARQVSYPGLWLCGIGGMLIALGSTAGIHARWKDQDSNNNEASQNTASDDLLEITPPKFAKNFLEESKQMLEVNVKSHSNSHLQMCGIKGETWASYYSPSDEAISRIQDRLVKLAVIEGPIATIPKGSKLTVSVPLDKVETGMLHSAIGSKKPGFYFIIVVVYRDSLNQPRASRFAFEHSPVINRFTNGPAEFFQMGSNITEDDLHPLQRPTCIFSRAGILKYEIGKKVEYEIMFQNDGSTPAIDGKHFVAMGIIPTSNWENLINEKCKSARVKDTGIRIVKGRYGTLTNSSRCELNQETLDAMSRGELIFVAAGRIEYRDEAAGFHWTEFCITYDGKRVAAPEHWNKFDANGYGEGSLPGPDNSKNAIEDIT